MKRKKVTFSRWAIATAAHAAVALALSLVALVLDINDVLNVLPLVTGILLILLLGAPFFGYVWANFYVERYNRRIPKHFCTCGYDLTGNVSGVCPECGARVDGQERDLNAKD
jgi:hypothetical protein